jgi:hypothetical protein
MPNYCGGRTAVSSLSDVDDPRHPESDRFRPAAGGAGVGANIGDISLLRMAKFTAWQGRCPATSAGGAICISGTAYVQVRDEPAMRFQTWASGY